MKNTKRAVHLCGCGQIGVKLMVDHSWSCERCERLNKWYFEHPPTSGKGRALGLEEHRVVGAAAAMPSFRL